MILTARGRWVALAAGAGLPLSFAPFEFWWLAPLLLALLFLVVEGHASRERALRGFWFGFGSFATGTYWLYISIHDFGGVVPPIAVALCGALILLMAAYGAAWGFLTGLVARQDRAWQYLAVLPATWVGVEWVRGWLFSGFPWLSLGYGQIDGPLAAWAPVAGVQGVSLVVVLGAGALALLLTGTNRERMAAAAVLAVTGLATALLAGRDWTVPAGEPLDVALIQGGISQDRKWLTEELETTKTLFRDLTVGLDRADLIIWPEAAIPALAHEEADFLRSLGELMKARHQELVLGMLTFDFGTGEFRNSLLTVGASTGVYHKRHLVPFGEYFPVPDFVRNVLRLMNLPYTDITPGLDGQRPLLVRGVALAPSICYEDAFGNELRDFLPEAGLLVNVSNDGWFGDSIAPHQHLQMARFRALESGRFMLRSTNTGITAVIDPRGQVVSQGEQFKPVVVSATVQPRSGATPWIRFGTWPALGVSALLLVSAAVVSLRPSFTSPKPPPS
ncbi:MAG: apolipoprotein N-acyltransferase [Gammaproteobacteria bacterium]